jgi:hypothetical protein
MTGARRAQALSEKASRADLCYGKPRDVRTELQRARIPSLF